MSQHLTVDIAVIQLTAVHLPGHLNVIADEKSRVFDDKTEWKLNAYVFQHVPGSAKIGDT